MKAWKSISTKLSDPSQPSVVPFNLDKVRQYHRSVSLRVGQAKEHTAKLRTLVCSPRGWPKVCHVGEKVTIELPESLRSDSTILAYLRELDGFFHSLYGALESFAGEVNLFYGLRTGKPTLKKVCRKFEDIYSEQRMSANLLEFVKSDFYSHFADTRHLLVHNIGLGLVYSVDIFHQGEITPHSLCLPDNPETWPFSSMKQLKTLSYCEKALEKVIEFLETSYEVLEIFLFGQTATGEAQ